MLKLPATMKPLRGQPYIPNKSIGLRVLWANTYT